MWRAALRLRLLGWEESRAGVSLSVQCCSQTITRTKTHWVSGLTVYSVGLLRFHSYQVKMIKVNWFCTVKGLYKVFQIWKKSLEEQHPKLKSSHYILLIESRLKFRSPQNIWLNFSFCFLFFYCLTINCVSNHWNIYKNLYEVWWFLSTKLRFLYINYICII